MDVSKLFDAPKKPAYLDSAASSLTAKPVLEKMGQYYKEYRANIHRGAHKYTRRASQEYEAVYDTLAKFFSADAQEFANVRNTTEAVNAVALGLPWKSGDEVVVTDIEHHSNLLPWLRLKKQGVDVKIWKADSQGRLDAQSLKELLTPKTKLVAFTACSNVLGQTVDVKTLAATAKKAGALVFVDAAQYVGHHPVSLKEWPVDFMAFSAHKCFGPTGTGVLFHRKNAPLEPWFVGGGTIRDVTLSDYKLLDHRERFEAGTPAIAEWIGLGEALATISKIGYSNIESHEKKMSKLVLEGLADIPHVSVYGPTQPQEKGSALFAFNVDKLPHHQTAMMLDQMGFAVRSGHHCAMPLTKKLGVEGTVRASMHIYNTDEEAAGFLTALEKVAQLGA